MIFTVLSGKYVGIEEATSGLQKLYYRHVELFLRSDSRKLMKLTILLLDKNVLDHTLHSVLQKV